MCNYSLKLCYIFFKQAVILDTSLLYLSSVVQHSATIVLTKTFRNILVKIFALVF